MLIISSLFPYPRDYNAGSFVYFSLKKFPPGTTFTVIAPVSKALLDKGYHSKAFQESAARVLQEVPSIRAIHYVPYHGLPRFLMPFTWPELLTKVSMIVRHTQSICPLNLIHSHFLFPEGMIGAYLSARLKIPAICTLHGSDVNVVARRWYMRPFVRWAMPKIAGLIFVSNALRSAFEQAYSSARLVPSTVIPNGYLAYDSLDPDATLGCYGMSDFVFGKRLLLFVGGLKQVKRADVLLDAFSKVASRHRDVVLAVVGDGPQRRSLEETVLRKSLQDRVSFVGRIPNASVRALMRRSDLLVLSSDSEGLPTVILEALAEGTPVVSTDVGGIREVVNSRCGVLCKKGDSSSLAQAVLDALAREWDRKDIKACVAPLEWGSISSRVKEFYDSICLSHRLW
ncbi:MAG TPA: glycosyltransferase family 4 protein [Firmicutes bacterium]|nr:glycosyltransferase family 4 protein [Bacillota bacterium]